MKKALQILQDERLVPPVLLVQNDYVDPAGGRLALAVEDRNAPLGKIAHALLVEELSGFVPSSDHPPLRLQQTCEQSLHACFHHDDLHVPATAPFTADSSRGGLVVPRLTTKSSSYSWNILDSAPRPLESVSVTEWSPEKNGPFFPEQTNKPPEDVTKVHFVANNEECEDTSDKSADDFSALHSLLNQMLGETPSPYFSEDRTEEHRTGGIETWPALSFSCR